MELKIKIIFFALLFNTQVFSQIGDSLNINFEKSKYESIAELELELRYKIKPNHSDGFNYLNDFFPLKELKTYSIPIFTLKEGENIKSCKKTFLELINFESNPNHQKIIVEHRDRIVSEFSISDKTFNSKIDSFYEVVNALNYYRYSYDNEFDFPFLIGGPYKFFFVKERLERKYFRFDVDGFKGTFILKGNNVFYVTKELPANINLKQLTIEEEFKFQKTIFIKVGKDFLNEIKNEIKNIHK